MGPLAFCQLKDRFAADGYVWTGEPEIITWDDGVESEELSIKHTKEDEAAQEHIVPCSRCGKPAWRLDCHFPFQDEHNVCREHNVDLEAELAEASKRAKELLKEKGFTLVAGTWRRK